VARNDQLAVAGLGGATGAGGVARRFAQLARGAPERTRRVGQPGARRADDRGQRCAGQQADTDHEQEHRQDVGAEGRDPRDAPPVQRLPDDPAARRMKSACHQSHAAPPGPSPKVPRERELAGDEHAQRAGGSGRTAASSPRISTRPPAATSATGAA